MKAAEDRVHHRTRYEGIFPIGIVGEHTPEVKRIAAVLSKRSGRSLTRPLHRSLRGRVNARKGSWELRGIAPRGSMSRQLHPRGYGGQARPSRGPAIYLVNALATDRTTEPGQVAQLVRSVRARSSDVAILVLLDETNPAALRAARESGATGYLGAREASNDEAIHWRVWDALRDSQRATALSHHVPRLKAAGNSELLPPPRVMPQAAPTAAEIEAAREAVEGTLGKLPVPAERLVQAAELIRVDAPALRDPKTGRLDAARIAAVLGVPVSRLRAVAGVTQQALSARPASPRAQAGLQPIARVLAAVEELLPDAHRQMWLNTPLRRLGGETPLAMILDGRADVLARTLERALEGGSE